MVTGSEPLFHKSWEWCEQNCDLNNLFDFHPSCSIVHIKHGSKTKSEKFGFPDQKRDFDCKKTTQQEVSECVMERWKMG